MTRAGVRRYRWTMNQRNHDDQADDAGRCDRHRKVLFISRAVARRVRKRYPSEHLNAFPCDERPELWHLGKLPSTVARGVSQREDVVSLPRTA